MSAPLRPPDRPTSRTEAVRMASKGTPSFGAVPRRCRRCGYDLRGLPGVGTCPECGNYYDVGRGFGLERGRETPASVDAAWDRFVRWLPAMGVGVLVSILLLTALFAEAPGNAVAVFIAIVVVGMYVVVHMVRVPAKPQADPPRPPPPAIDWSVEQRAAPDEELEWLEPIEEDEADRPADGEA